MNGVWAVMKKDWRSFYFDWYSYIIMGLYAFMMGIYFTALMYFYNSSQNPGHFNQQKASLDDVVGNFLNANSFIITFLVPIISMRMFAEEKRQQTFELLFTSPIRVGGLVAAKYMAVLGLVVNLLLVSGIYLAFLYAWGNPETSLLLAGFLGLLLMTATNVALGGLISSFCSSQAIAAIVTYFALLILWLLPALGSLIYTKIAGVSLGTVLSSITPQGHFKPFVDGVVHAKHVWFYVSASGFLLYLTSRVVESNRWR